MVAALAATACVLVLARPERIAVGLGARDLLGADGCRRRRRGSRRPAAGPDAHRAFARPGGRRCRSCCRAVNGTMKRIGRSGQRASAVCAARRRRTDPASNASSRSSQHQDQASHEVGLPRRCVGQNPATSCQCRLMQSARLHAGSRSASCAAETRARAWGLPRCGATRRGSSGARPGPSPSAAACCGMVCACVCCKRDVAALALVAVEHVLVRLPAQDAARACPPG